MKRDWLAKMREEKGLSHGDMGKILGTTRQAYSNYEAGIRNPSLLSALKIAATLGFDPILFLEESDADSKHKEVI